MIHSTSTEVVPLTAQEWWDSVRDASGRIAECRARMDELRSQHWGGGVGGRSAVGDHSDPVGSQAVRTVDGIAELSSEVAELERLSTDGLRACVRVGAMMGDLAAQVMDARYLGCMTWAEVSYRCHVSQTHARDISRRAVELTDAVGIAHMVGGW